MEKVNCLILAFSFLAVNLVTAQNFSQFPPLVAYWPFDVQSGPNDVSGNNINGKYVDIPPTLVSGPFSIANTALTMGTSVTAPNRAHVLLNSTLIKFSSSQSWSLSMFVNLNGIAQGPIFEYTTLDSTLHAHIWRFGAGSPLYINLNGISMTYATNLPCTFDPSIWQFVGFVYNSNSNSFSLLCDSTLGTPVNIGSEIVDTQHLAAFGYRYFASGSSALGASFACASFFQGALTAAQFVQLKSLCQQYQTLVYSSKCVNSSVRFDFSVLKGVSCGTCQAGWTSYDCSIPIINCSSPCLNGGTCIGINKCSCDFGWTGSTCSIADYNWLPPMVAYWPFDSRFLAQDVSGNNVNGQFVDNLCQSVSGPFGLANTGLKTGTSTTAGLRSYIYYNSPLLDLGSQSWTISFWVNTNGLSSIAPFYEYDDGISAFRAHFWKYGSTPMPLYTNLMSGAGTTMTCNFDSGWQFVAAVYNQASNTFYLFCDNTAGTTIASSPPATSNFALIGYRRVGTAVASGSSFACASLFKGALSSSDLLKVKQLCKVQQVLLRHAINCASVNLAFNSSRGFNCSSCNPGWTSNDCSVSLCSSPCVNGTCVGVNTCNCTAGWTGSLCDTQILPLFKTTLVAYWPFSKQYGINDIGGNLIDGVYTTVPTSFAKGPFGINETAITTGANGANPTSYVTFNSSLLNFGSHSWTISLFVNMNGINDGPLFEYVTPGDYAALLWNYGTNTAFYYANGASAAVYFACDLNGAASKWQFVAAIYDNATKQGRVFCNETMSPSTTLAATPITSDVVSVGYRPLTNVGVAAGFACMSVHSTALVTADLLQLKSLCSTINSANLACSPNCRNGTCRQNMTSTSVGYSCTCQEGYSGPTCSIGNGTTTTSAPTTPSMTTTTFSTTTTTQATTTSATITSTTVSNLTTSSTSSTTTESYCVNYCLNNATCTGQNICHCQNGWNGTRCEEAICNQTCRNGGICSFPNYCSCVVGWRGLTCQDANVAVTTSDINSMTDDQLVANSQAVGVAVSQLAHSISLDISVPAVTDLLSTMDNVLNRLANRTDFSPDEFQSLAVVFSRASDSVMQSATNTNETSNGQSLDLDAGETSKCQINSEGEATFTSQSTAPALSADQLRVIFNSFMTMIVNMFTSLRSVLRPGTNMTFSGQFYGAIVYNLLLKDLPGLKLTSNLANVQFESTNSPYDLIDSFPAKCLNLQPHDMIHLVLSAFVVNALSVEKPFNMPTVVVRLYCQVQAELTLKLDHPILVTAIPSVKKAQLFASQKSDAQCEISTIKCDLSGNVDRIGSAVTFPLAFNAGDFVLIFPVIEFPYSAYISFSKQPGIARYDWMVNVTKTNVSLSQNSTYGSPRHFYNATADLRIIIPQAAIDKYSSTVISNASAIVAIYVYIKRDFSAFNSLEDLPPSACNLQRCYGYHLRLGLASGDTVQGRRRRSLTSDGFELEPSSSESAVIFKSSYFGDFGADLAISPNTIEFSAILANFSTLVAENSAVLAFQVVAVVFFIIGMVIVFKFDREDLKQWAFLPIISNQSFHKANYLISVDHSRVKHFELGPRVFVRFLGKEQDTVWRLLEDGIRKKIFAGKHPANFTLSSQMDLGLIEAIELKLECKTSSSKNLLKINVDRVTVVDVQRGHKFIFLVKATLQQGQELTVELASEDEMKGYAYLVSGHSRTSFTEIHPWLSIAQRPLPSNWTRCERMGCVVSAIFMAMLVNAMFYGKEASAPSVGLRVGRWFTISWFTVWTSFIGCLIVIPPTAVIAFIFKRVKRRSAEKSEWKTVFNMAIENKRGNCETPSDHLLDEKQLKKKSPFLLPFYCVIIAWALIVLCILTSASLVVFYSLSWGQEKSLQWLSGMIISVIQDIILIQPIKVLLSAIFSATVHSLPADGVDLGTLVYHKKTNKKKIELFYRLRDAVTAICHHIVYVIVFSCVISTMTNQNAYIQAKTLEPLVAISGIDQCTGTISNYATIFSWLNTTILYNVLRANKLEQSNILKTASVLYSVPNPNFALLGPIRVRQQRVKQASCEISTQLGRVEARNFDQVLGSNSVECQQVFSNGIGIGTSTEKRHFNNTWWQPLIQSYSFKNIYNISSDIAPWIYRETDGPPYAGWEASYKAGGYYVDLPKELAAAQSLINQLRQQRWLDNATTVFFVDFNLFNMQTNLFIPVKIVFEALSAGGMSYHVRLFPLQLYQYSGANSTLVFVVQGLYVILLISHLVKIILGIKKQTFVKYFKNGWNCLDSIQVGLGIGIVGLFAARIYSVIDVVTKIQTLRSNYTNLDLLANWEDLMLSLLGIQFFMTMILFFRHLSVNKHWAVLLATLSKGKQTLMLYTALFASATILCAAIAYLIMGFTFQSFSSYTRAVMTLIQGIVGTVDFSNIKFSRFYLFLMMAYNAVVVFVGGNFFITMILAAHREVVTDVENLTDWDSELSQFVSTNVREILANLSRNSKQSGIASNDQFKASPAGKESCADLGKALGNIDGYLGRSDKHFKCEMMFHLEMKSLFVSKRGNNYDKSNSRRLSRQLMPLQLSETKKRWKDVMKSVVSDSQDQSALANVVRQELYGKDYNGNRDDQSTSSISIEPVSPE